MTKNQVLKNIRSMEKEMKETIKKECKKLLESGAVDYESYENNFRLPKMLLYVALRNTSSQYYPLTKEGRKEVKNLLNF